MIIYYSYTESFQALIWHLLVSSYSFKKNGNQQNEKLYGDGADIKVMSKQHIEK